MRSTALRFILEESSKSLDVLLLSRVVDLPNDLV